MNHRNLEGRLKALERSRPPVKYGWIRRRIRVPYPDGSRPPEWYWGELPRGPGLDVPEYDDRIGDEPPGDEEDGSCVPT